MIVAIHGGGDRPESFIVALSRLRMKARLIAPRGLNASRDGYLWFPPRREGGLQGEAMGKDILRAASAMASTLKRLTAEKPTRGKAIVTGFSQGAAVAFALALHYPEVVGAAFPIAGWIPPSILPGPGDDVSAVPDIVALHGDADPRVAIGPTREAVSRLRRLGVRASLRSYNENNHVINRDMLRDLAWLIRQSEERARNELRSFDSTPGD